jgi:DNA-binding transcriptional MerR regulator
MLIGELAASLGVSPRTLRLYEARGLMPAPARASNGYRAYGEDAIRRARLVVGLRGIGLSLETIEKLIAESARPGGGMRRALAGILDERISEVSLELAVLQGRLDDLEARYRALIDTPRSSPPNCVCAALNRVCDCVPNGSIPLDLAAGTRR